MKPGRANERILQLAIPNIISNITIPLLSMVDTAMMGHEENPALYIGGVSLGVEIFNFIYWGFGFLRMGTTGLTAQALGSDRKKELSLIFFRGLFFALAISLVLVLLRQPLKWLSLEIMNPDADIARTAEAYFLVRIFAAPATLSLYVIQGWFLGMQNSRIPMFLTAITGSVNIGFNILFVRYFGMKTEGVALGTVCAQYTGVFVGIIFLRMKYKNQLIIPAWAEILNKDKILEFVRINSDIFIRTLLLIFTFSFFIVQSEHFSETILSANSILRHFMILMAYAVDGFAFAAESLTGLYVGRNARKGLRGMVGLLFRWGMGLALAGSVIYGFAGESVIRIFTDDQEIIGVAMEYLPWVILAPLINTACFIWDGIFLGATASKAMRNTMIISTLIIFLPVFYLTRDSLHNHSLWLATSLFMVSRGILMTIMARKHVFKSN